MSARFTFRRRLGEGGFGVVYEADDHRRGTKVALKTLRHMDAAGLYAFKNEFRALADVVHPNLIALHELVSEGEQWFFTMDLVEGKDFATFARGRSAMVVDPTVPLHTYGEKQNTESEPLGGPLRTDAQAVTVTSPVLPAPSNEVVTATLERVSPALADLPSTVVASGRIRSVFQLGDPGGLQGRGGPLGDSRFGSRFDGPPSGRVRTSAPSDPEYWARLRSALFQLADGLIALHSAGKLHRDLKPSNVLVSRDGTVKILDFGLVMDLSTEASEVAPGQIVGTPAYMAPEQAAGKRASPANDWYAVGVMLYEVLTGVLPFEGDILTILTRKASEDPVPPSALVAGIPIDLDTICIRLLNRSPAARPSGQEVLEVGRAQGINPGPALPSVRNVGLAPVRGVRTWDTTPFVGREKHLKVLWSAHESAKGGSATTVHVRGVSGMGKSALVRHFLDELARHENTVILEGRCYEREAVPYKAVDNLIDALSRHLSLLADAAVAELLPRDVQALVRLFPVLDRVKAISAAPRKEVLPPDEHEQRRRGFAGLRELLARMADRKALVLHIDDLQWGDADSAALLSDLLREPGAPTLLLLIGYRSEDAEKSEMLRRLPSPDGQGSASPRRGDSAGRSAESGGRGDSGRVLDLTVGALEMEEATAVALHVLGDHPDARKQAEGIVKEAAGSPFFVRELSREVRQSTLGGESPSAVETEVTIRLETVLANRLSRLPKEARKLLETVSLAGRPLGRGVARKAAELTPDEERSAMDLLRAEHILRSRGSGADEELSTFHDRIRETTVAQLQSGPLVNCHLRIAEALEESGGAEPDMLAVHFHRGERSDRAVPYAVAAGDRAASALAFDRAADHFSFALKTKPAEAAAERELRIKLGDALRNAGRGAAAAREYTEAAAHAPSEQSLELRRRAADQLLRSGHLDEGRLALQDVLSSVRIRLFQNRWLVLLSFVFQQVVIALYRVRKRERKGREMGAEEVARLEACWSAAVGLTMTDIVQGAELHARFLSMALKFGRPHYLARGLAIEAAHAAVDGGAGRKKGERAYKAAAAIASELGDPYLIGLAKFGLGTVGCLTGRWTESLTEAKEAEDLWAANCSGVAWELASARVVRMAGHFQRGDHREGLRLARPLCEDAETRGDLYAVTYFRVAITYWGPMNADQPEMARDEVQSAMSRWSQKGFDSLHFMEMLALGRIDIFGGNPLATRQRLKDKWSDIVRSMILRLQFYRVFTYHLRAAAALAALASLDEQGPSGRGDPLFGTLLKEAKRDILRLGRERVPWAIPMEGSLRAGLSALQGDKALSLSLLREATAQFDACEMGMHAAATRRRLGELTGGEEGQKLLDEAETFMARQDIKNFDRTTNLFAPGFPKNAA